LLRDFKKKYIFFFLLVLPPTLNITGTDEGMQIDIHFALSIQVFF